MRERLRAAIATKIKLNNNGAIFETSQYICQDDNSQKWPHCSTFHTLTSTVMIFWAGTLTHKNIVEIHNHHTFATISRDFSNNTGGTFVHQGGPVLCIIILANVSDLVPRTILTEPRLLTAND
jgi:hypothetical protein